MYTKLFYFMTYDNKRMGKNQGGHVLMYLIDNNIRK